MTKSPYALVGAELVENGLSAIPIKPGSKVPGRYDEGKRRWGNLPNWDKYTRELPGTAEVSKWSRVPDAGVGICLGEVSGIIAIDLDYGEEYHKLIEPHLPPSPCKKKGAKGYTAFYRYSGEQNTVWELPNKQPVMELLSNGRQTVIPPSVHPETGLPYEWLTRWSITQINLSDLQLVGDACLDIWTDVYAELGVNRRGLIVPKRLVENDRDSSDYDLEDVKAALNTIDPDISYDYWVKIGMGLRASLGEQGKSLWVAWCTKGSKHKDGEPERKWETFDGGGITIKFMFQQAKEAGYKRKANTDWNNVSDDDFQSFWPGEGKLDYSHSIVVQEKKLPNNVVPIAVAQKLDKTAFVTALVASAAPDAPYGEALESFEKLTDLLVHSDGMADAWALTECSQRWTWLTAQERRRMQPIINKKRKDLKGTIEKKKKEQERQQRQSDEPAQALRADYFKLFQDLYPNARKDIFSGEVVYFDNGSLNVDKVWQPISNEVKEVKSEFAVYQEENRDIRFSKDDIEPHLYSWMGQKGPRLVVDVPEWDGRERIKELVNLMTLGHRFTEQYKITLDDVYEYVRDWHSRAWLRLWDPTHWKSQNRMLLIVGPQERCKDTWIKYNIQGLGQYAPNMSIVLSGSQEKDNKGQLHTGMILNLSEFDRSAALSAATLKSLITDESTNVRKAYGRSEKFRRARCSFISSCNREVADVLRDPTGNRRFFPIEVENIQFSNEFANDPEQSLQVLAEGQYWAKFSMGDGDDRGLASKESLEKMRHYLTSKKPQTPIELVEEVFDETVSGLIGQLTKQIDNDVQSWLSVTRDGFDGYLPNEVVQEHKIIDTVNRALGWRAGKTRELLYRARAHKNNQGVVIGRKVGGRSVRGLYFKLLDDVDVDLPVDDVPF